MAAYTLGLACMMPLGGALLFVNPQQALFVFQIHFFGCLLSGLVANVLIMQRAKRYTVKAAG